MSSCFSLVECVPNCLIHFLLFTSSLICDSSLHLLESLRHFAFLFHSVSHFYAMLSYHLFNCLFIYNELF